jgi:hypothetical protein
MCDQTTALERWLPITGFEGRYEVSGQGRVRALFTGKQGIVPPRLIGSGCEASGYRRVTLYNAAGGKYRSEVHRIVLNAFVGPCPEGLVCRHLNGKPADCRLVNLRWDTQKANIADTLEHGTRARGETQGNSKLTEDAVRAIRKRYGEGATQRELSRDFGISRRTVVGIVRGESWGWFEPESILQHDGRGRYAKGGRSAPAKTTVSATGQRSAWSGSSA